jgi:NADPH:quinone reductase-like Zn-dependent oxidoreductase
MTVNQNFAAWLPGVGKQIEVSHADVPEPGAGEILVEVSK